MAVNPGDKLGPYVIETPIGAGGMGAVWKARDTRLDRTVAIKFVEGQFSERFEREAKTIASLNHPHICTLFDVGPDYLVMEYIDGKPIEGPLPLAEVIRLGAQIAEALDAAHRKGITHRDLKPGNIIVTKAGAKVIDFGLAKAAVPVKLGQNDATLAMPLTGEGMILGTVPYMSPEQLQSGEADARSDIFALGCVLYEMLTGKRAFTGKSQVSLMAAILEHEPAPLTDSQPLTPRWLERAIRRCLRKNPDERWQSARDVAIELRESKDEAAPAKSSKRVWIPWTIAATATFAAVGLFFRLPSLPAFEAKNVEMSIQLPERVRLTGQPELALSPDGRTLAFVAEKDSQVRLFLRPLSSSAVRELVGTEGAQSPFWSPDSNLIAFAAANQIKSVDLKIGTVKTICKFNRLSTGAWLSNGRIVFTSSGDQVYSVAESGGEPKPIPNSVSGVSRHFVEASAIEGQYIDMADDHLYLGSMENGRLADLSPSIRSNIRFVRSIDGTSPGHIIYGSGSRLFAREFDAKRFVFSSEPFLIADSVDSQRNSWWWFFSAGSSAGELAYVQSTRLRRKLSWLNRDGKLLAQNVNEPAEYEYPRISPDGTQIAYCVRDAVSGLIRTFVAFADGTRSRMVEDSKHSSLRPTWSPEGTKLATVVSDSAEGKRSIGITTLSSGETTRHLQQALTLTDWTVTGHFLYHQPSTSSSNTSSFDVMSFKNGASPVLVSKSAADAVASPDGHWLLVKNSRNWTLHDCKATEKLG